MAVIILAHIIPIAVGVALLKKDVMWAIRRRQDIARALIRFLKIRITQTGDPQDGNYLFIANHQSYIDPVIKAQALAFLPVAKAEVAQWPLFGFAAKVTGILFVVRDNKESRADIRAAIKTALLQGKPVLVYPEGTTSAMSKMLPLRPGAFQSAAGLGKGVVPIAIRYEDVKDAWIGSESFMPHFLRSFGKPEIQVRVHFGDPIFDDNAETLLEKNKSVIDQKLAEWEGMAQDSTI